MYYSDDLIEEIRSRNDIVDVVSTYVKLQKRGSTYFGLCPFHSEKSPSFSVTPSKQMYYCFGCGAGGNAYTFIMKYENYSFTEAVKVLADRAGIPLPEGEYSNEDKKRADLKARLLEVNKEAAKYFYHVLKSERGRVGYEYLKKRGLSDETITRFGLGYSTNYSNDLYEFLRSKGFEDNTLKEAGLFNFTEKKVYDKFSGRVMFPIMDTNNRVIGFGGRVMGDGQPKYLNSPSTIVYNKGRHLYGLNNVNTNQNKKIIIVEGYMDAVSLHQRGIENAVASLGTALTEAQGRLLRRVADQIIIGYDQDGAGQAATMRGLEILDNLGCDIRILQIEGAKDPDEFVTKYGSGRFLKYVEEAISLVEFKVKIFKKELNLDELEEVSGGRRLETTKLFSYVMAGEDSLKSVAAKFSTTEEELIRLNNIRDPEKVSAGKVILVPGIKF